MRRIHQTTGVVLLLLAAWLAAESLGLRYYSSLGPGPGFFPRWLAGLLGLLAVALICEATFGRAEARPDDLVGTRAGYQRMAAIVAALGAVAVLLEPLGFRLTMLGFYLFLLTALGRQKPVIAIAVALAGSFGTHFIFAGLLKAVLPVGPFGI